MSSTSSRNRRARLASHTPARFRTQGGDGGFSLIGCRLRHRLARNLALRVLAGGIHLLPTRSVEPWPHETVNEAGSTDELMPPVGGLLTPVGRWLPSPSHLYACRSPS